MMKKLINVAIDGTSSSGKSTMAKALAKHVGYTYIDTGAMYRAVTLFCLQNGLISNGVVDEHRLLSCLDHLHIEFRQQAGTQATYLNGTNVEREIRGIEVSNHVSQVAAVPQVRHALVRLQQEMGRKKGVVMDGRDIGTTVLPGAEIKVYVTSSAEERAQRRFAELQAKGDTNVTFEEVLKNVQKRDHIDMTRQESPLRKADDAIELDSTFLDRAQQAQWLLDRFEQYMARH